MAEYECQIYCGGDDWDIVTLKEAVECVSEIDDDTTLLVDEDIRALLENAKAGTVFNFGSGECRIKIRKISPVVYDDFFGDFVSREEYEERRCEFYQL